VESVVERLSEVVELGVDDTLIKPVKPVHLLGAVEKALERRRKDAEIKRLNSELTESNRQLGQINSFQTRFFHMVAHDVKNPLTAILGYCEVIGAKFKNNPDAIRYSTHIHSAAKALNALISDLVDLAAIESGKLRVDMVPMDFGGVVGEVKSRIDVVAGQRKINFSVQLPQAPLPVQGDPQRLGQVVQNLCTNAIQYTKEGGSVTIRVDLASKDWMTVSVIDTGIGIAKEDVPRVWERFFQTAEAQKMRKGGFGLGLKIAREIVQRHGGEMGIESELGKGSRFFFHLPVRQ
jgi:signal transduction histidine kinase